VSIYKWLEITALVAKGVQRDEIEDKKNLRIE
jgi:hypothetical protein